MTHTVGKRARYWRSAERIRPFDGMPKSVEEILAQADEFADQLEQNDNPGEGSPALGAIHNAVVARSRSEAEIVKAVTASRVEGRSGNLAAGRLVRERDAEALRLLAE